MKAFIFAAGRGERMQSLTENTPKPLLKVQGKPLLQQHIERLVTAGFQQLVINAAYLSQQIIDFVGDGQQFGCDIQISCEKQPLETAGGLIQALPLLGDQPFVAINSDIWCDYPLAQLQRLTPAGAHLVLSANPKHNPTGDFSFSAADATHLQFGNDYTFSGIGVYHPQILRSYSAGKRPLREVFTDLIAKDQLTGEVHQGTWLDVGTPERLQLANQTRLNR